MKRNSKIAVSFITGFLILVGFAYIYAIEGPVPYPTGGRLTMGPEESMYFDANLIMFSEAKVEFSYHDIVDANCKDKTFTSNKPLYLQIIDPLGISIKTLTPEFKDPFFRCTALQLEESTNRAKAMIEFSFIPMFPGKYTVIITNPQDQSIKVGYVVGDMRNFTFIEYFNEESKSIFS